MRSMLPLRVSRVALSFFVVFVTLFFPTQAKPELPLATDHPVVARITVRTPSDVTRIASLGLDLLETQEDNARFILTTAEEIEQLRAQGWVITIDVKQSTALQQQSPFLQPRAELFQGGYRTVSEIYAFLQDKAAQYPNLTEIFQYGSSWEKITSSGPAGHDLLGIRLTNKNRPGAKPILFLMAAIHARELSTAELALRFIDYLLNNYGTDGDATWLLDEHLIVVVPVVNPDGRVLAEQGYLQRKNTNTSYGGNCLVPAIGVDLNRNSFFKWGTINTPTESFCSQTYPGPVAVSEPETAALQDVILSLFPDQRGPLDTDPAPPTATGMFITLHSYGNLTLWPWGWTASDAPNGPELSAIGRKLSAYTGFTPQQANDLYPTSGTTEDWVYGTLGTPTFVFEVGPSSGPCGGFFPPFNCLDGGTGGSFWSRTLPAFLYAARIARAPFQLVQGPTPEASLQTSAANNQTEIRVRFDENKNGGQPIVSAEYVLDVPPWSGGIGIPMAPVDGAFNSVSEEATAFVGPFTESRQIYTRARDSQGNWGPIRGVLISPTNCLASLSPFSQAFSSIGGIGTVTVTIANGCTWTATSDASWITITGGSNGAGSGTVSFSVHSYSGSVERNGSLSIAGQHFSITQTAPALPNLPDLIVTTLSDPPALITPRDSFLVTDTVQNTGVTTAKTSTTRYYFSLDARKDKGDKRLRGRRRVQGLTIDAMSTGTVVVTVPANTLDGNYFLLACADDSKAVKESDETNNCQPSATPVLLSH